MKGTLTTRADTGSINSSPVSAISPVVRLLHGCSHTIRIPGMLVYCINEKNFVSEVYV